MWSQMRPHKIPPFSGGSGPIPCTHTVGAPNGISISYSFTTHSVMQFTVLWENYSALLTLWPLRLNGNNGFQLAIFLDQWSQVSDLLVLYKQRTCWFNGHFPGRLSYPAAHLILRKTVGMMVTWGIGLATQRFARLTPHIQVTTWDNCQFLSERHVVIISKTTKILWIF